MKPLVPSYNRYSHHARRALSHATALVSRFRHPFADTGHLLVGVLLTKGSIGYAVMQDLDIDINSAGVHLSQLLPAGDTAPDDVRNADDLNTALAFAADESAWFGHHYIGTEHLLLGITRTNVGNARTLFRLLDVSPESVRRRVRHALSDGAREQDLQLAKRIARLSELSRRVISGAEQMAVNFDHASVGIGHLLLMILLEGRSTTSALLRESGLDEDLLRSDLDSGEAALMVGIEVVLEKALEKAHMLDSHYTGTEHLLLTLTGIEAGMVVLAQYGVDADLLRRRILEHTGSG